MATFYYIANHPARGREEGTLEAADLDEARRKLVERGLQVDSLHAVATVEAAEPLSAAEATQLGVELAHLVSRDLPLPEGLRATAVELAPSRVSQSLTRLADALAQGHALPEALDACGAGIPPHLRAVIVAGSRSGRLDVALQRYVEWERRRQQLRRELRSTLAYPAFLLAMLVTVGLFLTTAIIPELRQMYDEYKTALPKQVVFVMWVLYPGVGWLLGITAVLAAVLYGVTRVTGNRLWHGIRSRVPLIGRLFYFQAICDFVRLLTLLLEQGVPLPEALRLTARGVRDATCGAACGRLAAEVERGRTLADALGSRGGRPVAALAPIVHWGETHSALPQALDAVGTMYADRAAVQLGLVQVALPPLMFLVILAGISLLMGSILLPMYYIFRISLLLL